MEFQKKLLRIVRWVLFIISYYIYWNFCIYRTVNWTVFNDCEASMVYDLSYINWNCCIYDNLTLHQSNINLKLKPKMFYKCLKPVVKHKCVFWPIGVLFGYKLQVLSKKLNTIALQTAIAFKEVKILLLCKMRNQILLHYQLHTHEKMDQNILHSK